MKSFILVLTVVGIIGLATIVYSYFAKPTIEADPRAASPSEATMQDDIVEAPPPIAVKMPREEQLAESDPITPTVEIKTQENVIPTEELPSQEGRIEMALGLKAEGKSWDELYKDVSLAEINRDITAAEKMIFDMTKDDFEYRFSTGQYEVVSEKPVYETGSKTFDPTSVYQVRIAPGGPVQKVVLPKELFPEAYELKALSAWLNKELAVKGKLGVK